MNEFDDLEIELNKTKNIFSKTWCQKSNIWYFCTSKIKDRTSDIRYQQKFL